MVARKVWWGGSKAVSLGTQLTEGQDLPPERGLWEGLPAQQPSTTVPRWAIPAAFIGLGCSLVVAWMSADYFADLTRG